MRTIGIEEELLLVDQDTGHPLAVATRVLDRTDAEGGEGPGGSIDGELQQEQVETGTRPRPDLAGLEQELRTWRSRAHDAARAEGAAIAAVGTAPLPVSPNVADDPRYRELAERFGRTTQEHLTCGCHVHVAVESGEEGVAVLDRIRVWLPVLLALSTNSPFWQGGDTRYSSYRAQAMQRWPSTGPTDVLGSERAYRNLVSAMVGTGVLMDEGMVYFDARLSHEYPTVEVRTADVCLDVRDAVVVAALSRALVETAARAWREGESAPPVPSAMVRLATWQASRYGLSGNLLDATTGRPRGAEEVVGSLVEYVRPALRATGDEEDVEQRIGHLLQHGTGATRQRRTYDREGDLAAVVTDAVLATAGETD